VRKGGREMQGYVEKEEEREREGGGKREIKSYRKAGIYREGGGKR
jgi:hypothetical protein